MIEERLKDLAKRKHLFVSYLKDRVLVEDWHGVQDAASDIREIEAEMRALESCEKG